MKIIFIGDIVGRIGRTILFQQLQEIKKIYHPDMIIVNGENSAHGKGITPKIYQQFKEYGVDVITLGNHAFSKSGWQHERHLYPDMIRPANMEPISIQDGYCCLKVGQLECCIINLLGQAFMDQCAQDPFLTMHTILNQVKADIYFVDFHGEATAEKVLFSKYYSEKCVGIVGTHTHVQTADDRIENGCACISDVGMTGTYEGVLGRDFQEVLQARLTNCKTYYTPAKGKAILCGVCITVDEATKQATKIERIQIHEC